MEGGIVKRPLRESDIEEYLDKRVKELGGLRRGVNWKGRPSAPDDVVMLPSRIIWIECKEPGGAAKFPSDALEEAQAREHKRMRDMGQRVEVVDSYERVDEVLS